MSVVRRFARAGLLVIAAVATAVAVALAATVIPPLRDLLTLNQGAVGAVIGFLASLGFQTWRDRAAERRAIAAEQRAYARQRRTARFDRVRDAYQKVLSATWAIQSARVQMIAGTGEENLTRIQEILEKVQGINDATERLALEEDTEDVRALYRKLHIAFTGYVDAARASDEEIDRRERSERMKKGREEVEALTKEIEVLVPAKLRALEADAIG